MTLDPRLASGPVHAFNWPTLSAVALEARASRQGCPSNPTRTAIVRRAMGGKFRESWKTDKDLFLLLAQGAGVGLDLPDQIRHRRGQ